MRTLLQAARTAPSAEYFKGYRDGLRWDSESLDEGDPGADTSQIAQLIVTALEDAYTSGVEALLSYARDGDTIYGRFRDGAKVFAYTLKGDQISYWLMRGPQRTDSVLQIPLWRADNTPPKGQKSKNAGKGIKCGRGYISPDKKCRFKPSPEAKEAIANAAELIDPFSPENNPNFPKGAAVESPPKARQAKSKSKPKPAPEPEIDDFEAIDLEPVDTPLPKKRSKAAKKPKPAPEEKPKAEKKTKKEKDDPPSTGLSGTGWKPTMTEDEAKEFTKDSYFQEPLYHGTSKAAADSIQSSGPETRKIGRGQFGAGFYLAGRETEADSYAFGFASQNPDGSINMSQASTMTVRVNIRKPKVFRTSTQFSKFKEKLGFRFIDNDPKSAKMITDELRKQGFDGIHIKDRDYVVAFDKEQVVVTNSREARDINR